MKRDKYCDLVRATSFCLTLVYFFFVPLCSSNLIAQKLIDVENIYVKDSSLTYDQRVHRDHHMYASFLSKQYPEIQYFSPQYQGQVLTTYRKHGDEWFVADNNVKSAGGFQFRDYKLDVWLQPDYRAIYGNLNKAVETKTGLLISTKLQIVRGLSVYSGLYIPLINDFDQQPLNLRWGPTYLDYFMKIGNSGYAQLSGGLFFQDRYGFKAAFLNYPLDKSWSYGIESSFSGYYYFYPKSFKYTGLREFSILANVAYRFKKHDLTLKLSGGQFLHSDRGFRADFIRQFKKAEIGLFGISSGNGATIGVDVAFRVWPGTLLQNKRMRLRTAEDFPFQYLYSRGFKIGEAFKTYTDLSRRLRQQHVYYWNEN